MIRTPAPCAGCDCIDYIRVQRCVVADGAFREVRCVQCGIAASKMFGSNNAIEAWNTMQARNRGGSLHVAR